MSCEGAAAWFAASPAYLPITSDKMSWRDSVYVAFRWKAVFFPVKELLALKEEEGAPAFPETGFAPDLF